MSSWTDEQRAQVIETYCAAIKAAGEDAEAIQEASTASITELSNTTGKTVAGVRLILNKAGVYVKKAPAAKADKPAGSTTRINKAEAHATLTSVVSAVDTDLVDDAIISKLTGKAAVWLTDVIKAAQSQA